MLTQIFLISREAKLFGIRCCLRNLQSNTRRLSWNRPKSTFVRCSNNLEQHLALKLKLNGCRSWTQRWNAFNPFLYHPKDQFLYHPKDLWNWSWLFWDKKVKLTKHWLAAFNCFMFKDTLKWYIFISFQLSYVYYWLLLSRRMSQHRDCEENYWEDSGEDVAPNFCHKRYWVNLKMVATGNWQQNTKIP